MITNVDGMAIEAAGLARRYGRRWALADVSFTLARGEVMMLAGPNGAGKTTLLRVLATAIRPDGGRATVGGFDLREREAIRRTSALLGHAGYVYESLTARENLEIVARFLGGGSPAESRRHVVPAEGLMPAEGLNVAPALSRRFPAVHDVLARVGLAARADDEVSTFSAGMRKRLSFARVLLQRPRIALLDEPYGQLDPAGFALVEEVVRELKGRGATVILATHQVERVTRFADRALRLEGGRVAA